MRPARELAALKLNVLAHIQPAAGEIEIPQVAHQSLHDRRPQRALHCAGANVDLRIQFGVGNTTSRALAAVVVGVKVEDYELSKLLLQVREQLVHRSVKRIVLRQRVLHDFAARLGFPNL